MRQDEQGTVLGVHWLARNAGTPAQARHVAVPAFKLAGRWCSTPRPRSSPEGRGLCVRLSPISALPPLPPLAAPAIGGAALARSAADDCIARVSGRGKEAQGQRDVSFKSEGRACAAKGASEELSVARR